MNVLQALVELYNHLPMESTHRLVAKGILENLPQMQDATIYDVAELTNTSRTTVWSMVQKLGYKNYSDFRHAMSNAVGQFTYYNRILKPESGTPRPEDGYAALLEASAKKLRKSADWVESIDPDVLNDCVERIHAFSRVSFYMPYRLVEVSNFQQNLAFAGKQTGYFCLFPEMLADAQTLDGNSLVIYAALEYAETLDMSPIIHAAHENGAEIWLLNDSLRHKAIVDWSLPDAIHNPQKANMLEPFLDILSEWYRIKYIRE